MADEKLNYINVGPGGSFRSSGALKTSASDVDAIFASIKAAQAVDGKPKHIAIHFHGGLIPEQDGKSIADKMSKVYSPASHPVTFVWETGLIETIKNNLSTINETTLFQKVLVWVVQKAAKNLGLDVDAKGVRQELPPEVVHAELAKDYPFETLRIGEGARGGAGPLSNSNFSSRRKVIEYELMIEMRADAEFRNLLSGKHHGFTEDAVARLTPEAQSPDARGIFGIDDAVIAVAKIVIAVLVRFFKGRDHGFYPTVVEEILRELYLADFGAWVWSGMKTKARAMWLPNAGASGDELHAGAYFLDGVHKLQSEIPLTIDLIGHSAGSIAICHMLSSAEAQGKKLTVRNVFLLAPAARSDLFHQELVTRKDRYTSLRMFTMSDEFECEDSLVKGVYTRSLLYFISGVLEDRNDVPICGMDRYLLNAATYDDGYLEDIRKFLGDSDSFRLVRSKSSKYAPDAAVGFICNSITHGGFDDDPDTLASLKHLTSLA